MSKQFSPVTRAIEIVTQIEKDWHVLPKRTYLRARQTIADALGMAYAEGFRAGVVSAHAQGSEKGEKR